MKKIYIITIIIFLIFLSCSTQIYQLHIGKSHVPVISKNSFRGETIFSATELDSSLEITGIYCETNLFLDKYPIVRIFDKTAGLTFIPLTEKLKCNEGDLIKIKGKIFNLPVQYPYIKKVTFYKHLSAISYELISDTQQLQNKVTQEYQKIRSKLQNKITPKESKLQLKNNPKWRIWYKKSEGLFIFATHQYDLMYATDIEFIVDANSNKIIDVYAREWFKGEL